MRRDLEILTPAKSNGGIKIKSYRILIRLRSGCVSREFRSLKHRHLVGRQGNEEEIFAQYGREKEKKRNPAGEQRIDDIWKTIFTANARQKAIFAYTKLITLKNAPFSILEDPLYHDFSKHTEVLCAKTIKKFIFALTELM